MRLYILISVLDHGPGTGAFPMGIRLLRFPEYRLNLNIYSGAISAVDLI